MIFIHLMNYNRPYFNSLAEELVKAEGKGAIAAFSPSGLSLNEPTQLFHKALLSELLSGKHRRLGDAALALSRPTPPRELFPSFSASITCSETRLSRFDNARPSAAPSSRESEATSSSSGGPPVAGPHTAR
jgi:hypothetical protein